MNKEIPLSEIFHVSSRFRRSVHLERDFYAENSLDGYVVTVTARETLRRLISALENHSASKAWSLTGPYGSGKSAFALFAAKLVGNPDSPATKQALNLLERGDEALWNQFVDVCTSRPKERGFCPVLISGERAPITIALLRGLAGGLTAFGSGSEFVPLIKAIERRLGSATPESPPYASEITGFFETATHQIGEIGGAGLILVVDELGKFLEYAAQHPSQGDMFVLQSLAEFAARSEDTPLFLLTILHQAFEQYAQRLGQSQREEWAKVQGRFEDVAFMEPTEQVLRLIGDAIEADHHVNASQALGKARSFLAVSVDLDLKPRQLTTYNFLQLLENCLPLHPTVALIVGSLFRRFAQNERSLFALLNSGEPHGLQDFLANSICNGNRLPLFSLPDLYDYINTAFGNRLYGSSDGKKWAGIETAIARLPNPSPLMVALIRTIGLLGVVGEVSANLKGSTNLLRYALDDGTENYSQEFESALSELEKRSIAIYRRHNGAYALWEGSDIDIESRLSEATAQLDSNQRLATTISEVLPPQPLIARRYLFKTGTLRYFVIRYTDVERFDADLEEPLGNADGLVLYALPASEFETETLVKKATEVADRTEVLIAIPQSIGILQDAVAELARLRWVEDNTPELDGDETARRELTARAAEAEQTVSNQLSSLFGSNMAAQEEGGCTWYHGSQLKKIVSRRELNEYLSKICDDVYYEAPILRNELINQRQLSHSASRARRMLIKAMLECGVQENLGITGYPPEMSVYLSLLSDTGIHRYVSGEWGFHPPKSDRNNISYTWSTIEACLDDCEQERQPVSELYKRLEEPPIGLRSGPIPILLCAVLLHYEAEIALYEDGSFVTDVSIAVFERLIRSPEKFELKRFRMSGIRSEVFSQFLTLISKPSPETGQPNLLAVVKPLVRFVTKLPRYTMLTQELTQEAIELRKTITSAREPDALLFVQLPQALGFDAFGPYEEMNPTTVGRFFNTLQRVLSELNRAYDELLDSVAQLLDSAFSLRGNGEEIRVELYRRAESLLDLTIETKLKGFFLRVCDEELDFKGWLEAIGTYIVQKPPSAWNDSDNTQFQMNLAELGKKFHHFEAVSFERRKQSQEFSDSAGEVMRVGITTLKAEEQARVITLHPIAETQAKAIEREIEQIFEFAGVAEDTELRLAVLARLSRKLMEQLED